MDGCLVAWLVGGVGGDWLHGIEWGDWPLSGISITMSSWSLSRLREGGFATFSGGRDLNTYTHTHIPHSYVSPFTVLALKLIFRTFLPSLFSPSFFLSLSICEDTAYIYIYYTRENKKKGGKRFQVGWFLVEWNNNANPLFDSSVGFLPQTRGPLRECHKWIMPRSRMNNTSFTNENSVCIWNTYIYRDKWNAKEYFVRGVPLINLKLFSAYLNVLDIDMLFCRFNL